MPTRPDPTTSCTPNKGPLPPNPHPRVQVYQEHSLAWRLMRWPLILLALLLTLVLLLGPGVLLGEAEAASVQLAWQYTQGPDLADGYIVERCTGVGCTTFVAITPSPLPITTLIFNDTTVQPATSYVWRVRAKGPTGVSIPSNAVAFRVPGGPVAPTSLTGKIVP